MIEIGSRHLKEPSIQEILKQIEANIFSKYTSEKRTLLNCFIKNNRRTEEQLIHDLIFEELMDLRDVPDYYIDEYCQLVLWKANAAINNKENRELTIERLENILGNDAVLKSNFFPNFRKYTKKEKKSQASFSPHFKKIIETFDQVNRELSAIFSYTEFFVPHRVDLLADMQIDVCPYCNNAPIMTNKEAGVSEADIEHHLMKAEFSLFSSSFGNILPSCKACNSTHKNISLVEIINPRVEGFDEGAHFKVKYEGIDDLYKDVKEQIASDKLCINLDISETDPEKRTRISNSAQLFSLKKKYNTKPIKKIVRDLFIDFREWNSDFYKYAIEELANNKDYTQFMLDKIMKFESGSYETEDHVNTLHIKLKYDLYKHYVKSNINQRGR